MSPTSYQAAPPRAKLICDFRFAIADFKNRKSQIGNCKCTGGDDRDRTGDLLLAKQALSQLSYAPESIFDFQFAIYLKIGNRKSAIANVLVGPG